MMLGALGILAYAASMMTHEALGHGGYCLALGGHNVMLTTLGEACSVQPHGIEAAGPAMQFGAGLMAWFVVHRLSPGAARLRYFFWLYMVFNLLISSGYVVFSGITDYGDAASRGGSTDVRALFFILLTYIERNRWSVDRWWGERS